jgi:polyisoprenoid-binding protein YceI
VTRPVVLAAELNGQGMHPMANQEWAGFDATATILRSDFNLGAFTPFVGDEIAIEISIEAMKAAE